MSDLVNMAGAVVIILGLASATVFGLEAVLGHRRSMASPRRVLARRMAEGDIDHIEYLEALRVLAASGAVTTGMDQRW